LEVAFVIAKSIPTVETAKELITTVLLDKRAHDLAIKGSETLEVFWDCTSCRRLHVYDTVNI